MQIEIDGKPLSDVGLEDAFYVWPDGRRQRIQGVITRRDECVLGALYRKCPAGALLEVDGFLVTLPH